MRMQDCLHDAHMGAWTHRAGCPQLCCLYSTACISAAHASRRHAEAPAVLQTDEEGLDASEAFDQLQVSRVYAQDPDSLAFHAAKKQVRTKQTKQSHRSFLAVK